MLRAVSGLTGGQVAARLIPGGVYRSGQRVGLPTQGGFSTTTAIAADIMYAWPIPVVGAATFSGVALQVGTAVAGVSGKLGLALSGSDGRPGTLLAEAPTPVDMNSATTTELVAAFSVSVSVSGGIVWGLCVFNGAAQPVSVGVFNSSAILLGYMIGATGIGNYTLLSGVGPVARLSRAQTYASAFPASLTGWTATVSTAPSSPVMVGVVA